MKRLLVTALTVLMLVSGCQKKSEKQDAQMAVYEGYYTAIEAAAKFSGSSDYYTVSGEMTEIAEGDYRYYLVFDEPVAAMYSCKIMAVENDIPYDDSRKMMPTMGIFGTDTYSMIPYQVNTKDGYVKGIIISGSCTEPEVALKILVEWKDYTGRTNREFLSFVLTLDGMTHTDEGSGE